jgi:hypothetical protein
MFNLQLSLIGVGVQFDHFLVHKPNIDFGYSISNSIGIDYNGDFADNLNLSAILLLGSSDMQYEFALGPNIPIGPYAFFDNFQLIHYSIGARYTVDNFVIRLGSATTSVLFLSLGFAF